MERSSVTVEPASTLDHEQLAALFGAAYAGYWFPIELDAAGFEQMAVVSDLDLASSYVARSGDEPVGICVLGVRGDEGWIGGMGVVPERRREGIGEQLMQAVLESARGLRLRRVTLEVLEQNDPARRLYERLGFTGTRTLEVWTLPGGSAPEVAAQPVEVDAALDLIAATRSAPEPWQRADGTLRRFRERDTLTRALGHDGGAVVFRTRDGQASIVQLAAATPSVARTLLTSVAAGTSGVTFLNVPAGEPAVAALAELGGTLAARQYELELHP
jgi:ribosomal protein S18 acetylase RimI-like enzyme